MELVRSWLRDYGVQGVFDHAAALWFGRARSYPPAKKTRLDQAIVDVAVGEFGAVSLPIVTDLDFGHTDPRWILPLGLLVETDPVARQLRRLESPVR